MTLIGTETLKLLGNVTVNSIDTFGGTSINLQGNKLTTGASTGADTIAGAIVGTGGSLVKVGSDTLTLTGADTYSGPTTVSAGSLIVNGSLTSSTVSITGSGILGGTGSIANVTSQGVLNPGGPGTPGTLTVVGNLTIAASTLALDLSSSASDRLAVDGSVDITGTTLSLNVGVVTPGEVFEVLTTSGQVVGKFAGLPMTGSSFTVGSLTFTINYDAAPDALITVTVGSVPSVVSTSLNGGNSYVNSTLAVGQHSMVESVVYSFNAAVSLSASNFAISGYQGTPNSLMPTLSVTPNGTKTVWTVTFSGTGVDPMTHSIGDGEYSLALNIPGLSNTYDFFRLMGDMDGNGLVNIADFSTMVGTFLRATNDPAYLGADDLDGDGTIGIADINLLVGNFLHSVPAPLPN